MFLLVNSSKAAQVNFVFLPVQAMSQPVTRYQHNPLTADTTGFYDVFVPIVNPGLTVVNDSLRKYYDLSRFVYFEPVPQKPQLHLSQSVFERHELQPGSFKAIQSSRIQTDWILAVLLFCTALLAWARFNYAKRLTQIFRAVAQPHHVNQLEREGNLFGERITIGLILVYFFTFSLFLYFALHNQGLIPPNLKNYQAALIIFGALIAFQLIKSFFVSQLGVIFDSRPAAHFHQLNLLLFNLITGILLLPVCFLVAYQKSEPAIIIGAVIIALLLIYRLLRTALVGISNKNFNLFYLILYLCTLEILPLVLLASVAIRS